LEKVKKEQQGQPKQPIGINTTASRGLCEIVYYNYNARK
jgi:hypothetical protein